MTVREKVIDEVNKLPDQQLTEVLELIHQFQKEAAQKSKADIMSLAGSWSDMPEDEFNDFLNEVESRRRTTSRRERHATDAA